MPLDAAICRSLERKLPIFLGLGFFFAHRVGIDSKRQRGVRMPELIGHPSY